MIICWNLQKCRNPRSRFFFKLARYNYCSSKRFQNFNILWSGIVSLTRCCLQIFPTPQSFSVILSWKLENSKFSFIIYNFWYICSFEKNNIIQMYISVKFFLLNTKSWRSIALIRGNDIPLKNQCLPTGYKVYFK